MGSMRALQIHIDDSGVGVMTSGIQMRMGYHIRTPQRLSG